MAVSFAQFAAELKAFSNSGAVVNELRKELRKNVPELRTAVRESARSTLPSRNGLGAWVARAGMTVRVKSAGRTAGIRLKLSRKSGDGDKADLDALDKTGKIRHPLHGNRGFWYSQNVTPGFFGKPWEKFRPRWLKAADDGLDKALEVIRRG